MPTVYCTCGCRIDYASEDENYFARCEGCKRALIVLSEDLYKVELEREMYKRDHFVYGCLGIVIMMMGMIPLYFIFSLPLLFISFAGFYLSLSLFNPKLASFDIASQVIRKKLHYDSNHQPIVRESLNRKT